MPSWGGHNIQLLIGRALCKPSGSTTIDSESYAVDTVITNQYQGSGNPHATFDAAGNGNVPIVLSGAPVLDPIDEGELEREPLGYYASSLLYWSLRFHRLGDLEKVAIGFFV
jgi:hypothetical protein